jgi:hypothetical protein
MRARRANATRCSPKTAVWWLRLVVGVMFACYVNYIPAHLVTAIHLDDAFAWVFDSVFHPHDHADNHSEDPNDHHTPHPASDHTLVFASQTQPSSLSVLPIVFPLADVALSLDSPVLLPAHPIVERLKPPGESPPEPSQPRAPPIS